MSLARLVGHAFALPWHEAAAKAWAWGRRIGTAYLSQPVDAWRCSYSEPGGGMSLGRYMPALPVDLLDPHAEWLAGVTECYLERRFDLLGSGWVEVALEEFRPVNSGNLARAAAIREMIGADYRPIDWQRDFKSGFRWSERRLSGTVRYGHEPGVDIKVPWELARLQHLAHFAWAYALAREGRPGFRVPSVYVDAFRNQALDFVAANPPGFGVNWVSAMEVAIRGANLLVATDLFRAHGAEFDPAFLDEIAAAATAHGRHVVANLEWAEDFRGNHYLANVAGLLFLAAYLPRTPETDCWLAFSLRNLVAEVDNQFGGDGAGFEASTAYHRLSAEMAVYATALVLGLEEDKTDALIEYDRRHWPRRQPGLLAGPLASPFFPDWYADRIHAMAEFPLHITKPDGRVVQTGDNDSGRFFKFFPTFDRRTTAEARALYANLEEYPGPDDAPFWDEDFLDHRSLVAAANGLLERRDLRDFAGPALVAETALVRGLARAGRIYGAARMVAEGRIIRLDTFPLSGGAISEVVVEFPDPGVTEGLAPAAYPDFGLFIWRSARFFLAVRCGPVGQSGRGGHAHNDQLAIELQVDGVDWLADPGSFVYTPWPERREAYRSVRAHAAPRIEGREPVRRYLGLFRLDDIGAGRCLRFDGSGFVGVHRGFGVSVFRTLEIQAGRLIIRDAVGGGEGHGHYVAHNNGDLQAHFPQDVVFSPGYGKALRAKSL